MDEIVIAAYDPAWPLRYEREAEILRQALPPALVTRIEHFGSTAVPGLAAKPIIDLLVGVRSLAEARRAAVPILDALGYSYWADDPRQDHMFFVKGLPPNGPRSHHVHMIEPDSAEWEQLLFRDYLRAHPDEAARYAQLKYELAERHRADREAYTDAKADFVRSVLALARSAGGA